MNEQNVNRPIRRRRRKKKVPLGIRILRFFFGRPFRIFLIFLVLTAAVSVVGFLVYSLLCNASAPWEEIDSPPYESIPPAESGSEASKDGFLSDLREYEAYFNPLGEHQNAFLRLVNKEFPLKKKDVPDQLTTLHIEGMTPNGEIPLHLYTAKALEAMVNEMVAQGISLTDSASGLPIVVLQGYRSYAEQKSLFDEEVARQLKKDPSLTKEMAQQLASVTVTPPGLDEFQTGLSVAFAVGNHANSAFAQTEAYAWLTENAWKFGFILRYPRDNRPWHFRFVGRIHAELIAANDLTLEEYLDRVKL